MKHAFRTIIMRLIGSDTVGPFAGIRVAGQFRPRERDDRAFLRNINASFLIALSGEAHPLYEEALDYLETMRFHLRWGEAARFYWRGLKLAASELQQACEEDAGLRAAILEAGAWAGEAEDPAGRAAGVEKLRRVFFPEGLGICLAREEKTLELREKRKIQITGLNPEPVSDPAREVLFTSNVLLTVPLDPEGIDGLSLPDGLREKLKAASAEEQKHWYDHPIPIGIAAGNNEALHGIRGLDEAVEFEKARGSIPSGARATCILSVSVTHDGLKAIAGQYLEEELKKTGQIRHLDLYALTGADAARLVEEVLAPAMQKYLREGAPEGLGETIGVDGEYGRHYSFLKAVAALWQVLMAPGVKGTFKIDLDQVFPQKELVEEGGASAFELFKSPLWGAEGTDGRGREVSLGMIAGALVNGRDISEGIFTPDVCFPPEEVRGEDVVFMSRLPQALSTEAEMTTRYDAGVLDGRTACIGRVHVTGGTTGILIESLRKHRPFTPAFIGRAEDQAYVMSVLFGGERNLRYAHIPGLVMRHDKEALAGEAVAAARVGKTIGDYARILWFSFYTRALPWPVEEIKDAIDPFTGCFVSRIPFTVIYLRLALKTASLFADEGEGKEEEAVEFLTMGARRLGEIIEYLDAVPNPLIEEYRKEKKVWDAYYDVLDRLEQGIKDGEEFAIGIQAKAREILQACGI